MYKLRLFQIILYGEITACLTSPQKLFYSVIGNINYVGIFRSRQLTVGKRRKESS